MASEWWVVYITGHNCRLLLRILSIKTMSQIHTETNTEYSETGLNCRENTNVVLHRMCQWGTAWTKIKFYWLICGGDTSHMYLISTRELSLKKKERQTYWWLKTFYEEVHCCGDLNWNTLKDWYECKDKQKIKWNHHQWYLIIKVSAKSLSRTEPSNTMEL